MSDAAGKKASPPLVLEVLVIGGRDLAAKDRSGTSDPYLVLSLGDAKQATSTINRTLNPEWNQTIELPVVGLHSVILEGVCWDKDRFGKDYMGEFDVMLEDIFANGSTTQEPKSYPLKSKRPGKKTSNVTGVVHLQFTIHDPANPNATPQQVLQKLSTIVGTSTTSLGDDPYGPEAEDDDDDDDEQSPGVETPGEPDGTAESSEKKKRRLRIARIKNKAKQRGYEFTGTSSVAGVLFVEIQRITDLPPERNVTRTSFDMDPFVVTSLGRKTYRTRVIRHNLNPVYDEKLVFQVQKHETNYMISFNVVDRDNFSGNDYIGKVELPLEKIISMAPEADEQTGLFPLPDWPDGMTTPTPESSARKSRFRLPLSRSSSSQSLAKMARPGVQKQSSTPSLNLHPEDVPPPLASPGTSQTSGNNNSPPELSKVTTNESQDVGLKPFVLPLDLKNKDRWEAKHSPTLYVRAKYLPYLALRQQFWRAMLRQYDADESGRIDKVELTTMLDSLGSTLHESTIDSFFHRFEEQNPGYDHSLTFDQAVVCLEDILQRTSKKALGSSWFKPSLNHAASSSSFTSIDGTGDSTPSASPSMAALHINTDPQTSVVPAFHQNSLGVEGEEGEVFDNSNDLADENEEEHVIEIRECPICHQPRLNKRSDSDIITHIATCASQDWRQVNNIVMGGFVTASQAQRKWYSKVITKIGYGGYKLGANSANILVQDRRTGQINEERMSVYVRLGIRLLYKGLKSNNMEKKRIKKLLRSMSFKQGKKYDDPASVSQIESFVNFHQLDMEEVLLPMDQFKNFNEFFYRALKPDARPCSAPDRPEVVTSPADCRSVVFNTLEVAQKIWVKGRDFTVERLLANAYPEDAARYVGGALGIFRLAPQDYHRFHIPVDGTLCEPRLIEGEYYTVNPMAIRSALDVYGENVRVIVPIDSVAHGRVMVICVGAMMVGSTVITRRPGEKVSRAEELGYFKFGGSTILLLFEPGKILWDDDLVENSQGALETLIRVGTSVAHSPDSSAHTPDMQTVNPSMEEKQEAKRRIDGSLAPDRPAPTPAA